MAWIYKPKRKGVPSDKKRMRARLYNDTKYRKIRDWYMQLHPLCEMCLEDDKVRPSQHLHHVLSPFQDGISEGEAFRRLRDERNFKALCVEHHEEVHKRQEREKRQRR